MNGLEGEVARHLLATAPVTLSFEDGGARLVDDTHLSEHMHAILNDAVQLCVRELAEEPTFPLVELLADPPLQLLRRHGAGGFPSARPK